MAHRVQLDIDAVSNGVGGADQGIPGSEGCGDQLGYGVHDPVCGGCVGNAAEAEGLCAPGLAEPSL